MLKQQRLALIFVGLGIAGLAGLPAQEPMLAAKVDTIFATGYQRPGVPAIASPTSPGCAVGVSVDGKVVIEKAYGMADLEREVPNRPDTIFEAGSTSKQFAAAAVLLLAKDGKLSLDEPVRKYLPELHESAQPVTIRQMLTHTSGFRGWDIIAQWQGWPRTTRVYTQDHPLEILRRQRALNFVPGTRFSYSNTNYSLAAILVARVSRQSFAAFTRARIFEPLGMTRTSWRDDASAVVKGRALAYNASDPLHVRLSMAIDETHGPGGLLTTVGDLLKWNENFTTPRIGDAAFVAAQLERGRFSDGRPHEYTAGGLIYANYEGLEEINHSGGTAGYSCHLARFPEARLSVAVMCNGGNPDPVHYAHAIAELFRPASVKPTPPPAATHALSAAEIDAVVGLYRSQETGESMTLVRDAGTVRVQGAGPTEQVDGGWGAGVLAAQSASRFTALRHPWWGPSNGFYTWDIDPRGTARKTDPFGTVDHYDRVPPFRPTVDQLAPFIGWYESDEADARMDIALEGGSLVLMRQPGALVARPEKATLTPIYADAFVAPGIGTARFHRDGAGVATEFGFIGQSVWDLRFRRQRGKAGSEVDAPSKR